MTLNHLVLVGGGHSNVLLLQKWIMQPRLIPDLPITIISRDSNLVYSSMYPSVISNWISLEESFIDINPLANSVNVSFVKNEINNIDFYQKKIFLQNRPCIKYSKIILNCGMETKVSPEFKDLVKKEIAFPIKPFFQSYKFIQREDKHNSEEVLPFVIVGSGLAAIEISLALRKRWPKRRLILVCDDKKISKKILNILNQFNISIKLKINFPYKKILLCTGNTPQSWISKNILNLDDKGRIITDFDLKVRGFSEIYAVGDCSYPYLNKGNSSGILAVKAAKVLSQNLIRDFYGKKLINWYPQKRGLQIVNIFNDGVPKAFGVYGRFIFGPSTVLFDLKNKIDNNFIDKFKLPIMNRHKENVNMSDLDCRGCAAKIPQNVLNDSLRNAKLDTIADSPEDANEIYRSDKEIILQSIDGFPSLISDPWLNGRITALHACSDLWACGASISSSQVLVSIPKVDYSIQNYLFSQSLDGIRSVISELGGKILGGHTFESRHVVKKPYSLGIDIALTVQGILKVDKKIWTKHGMKSGDILLMSRPLGVGIFFAAQMQNFNVFKSYEAVFKNLVKSQQYLIEQVKTLEDQLGKDLINASTDITGYGFLGHLSEMISASNFKRQEKNLKIIKVILDLNAFQAYPGVMALIKKGVKSSLYEANKKIFEDFSKEQSNDKVISFYQDNDINMEKFQAIIKLLFDPQTCGPILISCESKYEKLLLRNWYKVGDVT